MIRNTNILNANEKSSMLNYWYRNIQSNIGGVCVCVCVWGGVGGVGGEQIFCCWEISLYPPSRESPVLWNEKFTLFKEKENLVKS